MTVDTDVTFIHLVYLTDLVALICNPIVAYDEC